ncbi:MAG: hypothetical protein DRI26_00630 [Chloroflexi bacterium]|nr:MAG: hypothetical protein DRI26_00630 [Chloroflexota bacterium]
MLVELKFTFRPVEAMPQGGGRGIGRSKYDSILDAFLESDDDIVQVDVENINPYYLKMMLKTESMQNV